MNNLLFAFLITISFQNKEEFVCTPCGYDCDRAIHASGGNCSSCGMALVKKSSVKFKSIDLNEMCNRMKVNNQVLLLDVRAPEEFNGSSADVPSFGHFKNAININVQELEKRIAELSSYKNTEVIVYCSHSHRSPRASYFLGTHGFTNVKNLEGGVSTFTANSNADCLKNEFIFHPNRGK
jgi:rhodanese-related sulfurtransferase